MAGAGELSTQWAADKALTSLAEVVRKGYKLVHVNRYPPKESTSGTYETAYYLQKGKSVVVCFEEFKLNKVGENARFTWSRFACFKLIDPQPYLGRRGKAQILHGNRVGNG